MRRENNANIADNADTAGIANSADIAVVCKGLDTLLGVVRVGPNVELEAQHSSHPVAGDVGGDGDVGVVFSPGNSGAANTMETGSRDNQ